MSHDDLRQSLALTVRHSFGELLDLPLLTPGTAREVATGISPAQALADYAQQIQHCSACSFHIGRSKLVFGRGFHGARIAFVGDFPSMADDKAGEPFCGADGELLHKMILAMKVRPEEAYLANIYKCRPPTGDPGSREHFQQCEKHLIAQFAHVQAGVIVAMGEPAAKALARSESPLQVLRKQVFEWNGRRVIPTHHPRDLHSDARLKKEAWEDLQSAMRLI